MISPFIKVYIIARCHREFSKQLKEVLNFYNKDPKIGKNRVVFSFLLFPTILEASSAIKNRILISAEWAVMLFINNTPDTRNAFCMTIGHELAHQEGDFAILYWERESKLFIHKEDRKFVNWVTEVHHDFAAAEKMVDSNKEKLLASINYKIKLKPKNEDSFTHPSWVHRKEYVKYIDPVTERAGEFSEALINKIADDVGCNNTELMKRVWEYYKLIVLH